ncbi:hypothetical protein [Sphingomonas bacterium]|uniref:hypothetical protein n=1 Tax=Sphingomonas bacterium TaxID=1895847 RepID=UPI00157523A6|nr:hypothetical protein [Sphingomonas bacterium]
MSRAINVNATPAQVTQACAKQGVAISAIEALKTQGTRLVLNNAADTATMSKVFGSKVLTGTVQRVATRLSTW